MDQVAILHLDNLSRYNTMTSDIFWL